jgi:hypothetical protein
MVQRSIMQRALGDDWAQLPEALKSHYQLDDNVDIGWLSVEYPKLAQWYLDLLHAMGALLNRRGEAMSAQVRKRMQGETQYWWRRIVTGEGREVRFASRWQYVGDNELIEYVNRLLGLRMAVRLDRGVLHYSGVHIVLKVGRMTLPIPEWLALGHTTIEETALDAASFRMDFRLRHPWFGQLYRYHGVFRTETDDGAAKVAEE